MPILLIERFIPSVWGGGAIPVSALNVKGLPAMPTYEEELTAKGLAIRKVSDHRLFYSAKASTALGLLLHN